MQGWGLLKEVWSPYTGADYAEVFKPKKDAVIISGAHLNVSNDVYRDVNTNWFTNIVL